MGLGVFNATMVLGQLASFETSVEVIKDYGIAGSASAPAFVLAIAALEILSLPVLLRLALSPAMRWLSASAVFLVPVIWASLGLWALMNGLRLGNIGYFGGFLAQPFNGWALLQGTVFLSWSLVALYVLGLVPTRKTHRLARSAR